MSRRAYKRLWDATHPDYLQEYQIRCRAKAKAAVICAYGGQCACCGEDNPSFLTLDHVNGGGKKHREELVGKHCGGGGYRTYNLVRRLNYPPDYQILCFNCNMGRALNGGVCPHKDKAL